MSTNFQSANMYTDRSKDTFQKNDTRKIINKENPIEVELMKNRNRINNNQIKKQDFPDRIKWTKANDEKMRPQILSSSHTSIAPTFEIFNTHTLVAKNNQLVTTRSSKTAVAKSRPNMLLYPHQPVITIKQHYNSTGALNNSDPVPKFIRHSNYNNPEEMRSMSAVIKTQPRIEPNISKSVSLKPTNKPPNSKSQKRIASANNKPNNIMNNSRELPNYDSLNRSRNKLTTKVSDQNNDPNMIYYSLPRKSKNQTSNESKLSSRTKPITMITDSHRKHKISIDPSATIESTTTIATDSSDTNPINFSSTLAKAATNSPPIKRRSSSIIHSPNPRMPARFASRSTINEMYTTKNYQENKEKYKKAANEILRENLALKFGSNISFLNQLHNESVQSRSSISSTSSTTSSGTDQQISISSIPHDDIPLDIPNKSNTQSKSKANESSTEITIQVSNTHETNELSDIVQGMVTFDKNIKEDADMVHLSDEDNDEYGEYDLDDDQTSSGSCTSESEGEDIENLKKKFIPLYEIERMVDDFALSNEIGGLPDHQHSQSFRVENTSVASNTEVFVHKGSLQKAKDALLMEPSQGILSCKLSENLENRKVIKRKAVFDPHILLLDACLEPDFELVKDLTPKVPNISKKTIDGITALHNAVCSADPKLVLFLLQSGADVNASDADGWTPLHCAACCNNKQISKILVEHGASLFSVTLSDFEIPSQKCNKASQEDTICEEYLFWEQENLGCINGEIVYALFNYEPQRDDELPLVPNQILKVLDTNPPGESGWFFVEDLSQIVNSPRRGFVAAAYVSAYQLILPQNRPDHINYRP